MQSVLEISRLVDETNCNEVPKVHRRNREQYNRFKTKENNQKHTHNKGKKLRMKEGHTEKKEEEESKKGGIQRIICYSLSANFLIHR